MIVSSAKYKSIAVYVACRVCIQTPVSIVSDPERSRHMVRVMCVVAVGGVF
jgi:hypothetical protein